MLAPQMAVLLDCFTAHVAVGTMALRSSLALGSKTGFKSLGLFGVSTCCDPSAAADESQCMTCGL